MIPTDTGDLSAREVPTSPANRRTPSFAVPGAAAASPLNAGSPSLSPTGARGAVTPSGVSRFDVSMHEDGLMHVLSEALEKQLRAFEELLSVQQLGIASKLDALKVSIEAAKLVSSRRVGGGRRGKCVTISPSEEEVAVCSADADGEEELPDKMSRLSSCASQESTPSLLAVPNASSSGDSPRRDPQPRADAPLSSGGEAEGGSASISELQGAGLKDAKVAPFGAQLSNGHQGTSQGPLANRKRPAALTDLPSTAVLQPKENGKAEPTTSAEPEEPPSPTRSDLGLPTGPLGRGDTQRLSRISGISLNCPAGSEEGSTSQGSALMTAAKTISAADGHSRPPPQRVAVTRPSRTMSNLGLGDGGSRLRNLQRQFTASRDPSVALFRNNIAERSAGLVRHCQAACSDMLGSGVGRPRKWGNDLMGVAPSVASQTSAAASTLYVPGRNPLARTGTAASGFDMYTLDEMHEDALFASYGITEKVPATQLPQGAHVLRSASQRPSLRSVNQSTTPGTSPILRRRSLTMEVLDEQTVVSTQGLRGELSRGNSGFMSKEPSSSTQPSHTSFGLGKGRTVRSKSLCSLSEEADRAQEFLNGEQDSPPETTSRTSRHSFSAFDWAGEGQQSPRCMESVRMQQEAVLMRQMTASRNLGHTMDEEDEGYGFGYGHIQTQFARDGIESLELGQGWNFVVTCSRAMFTLFCIMPFRNVKCSKFYHRFFACIIVPFLIASFIIMAIEDSDDILLHLSTLCYTCGGVAGLAFIRFSNIQKLLGPDKTPLANYARNLGFQEVWFQKSMHRFVGFILLWILSITERVVITLGKIECGDTGPSYFPRPISVVAFAIASGVFIALMYCHLHICCCLELMIDTFCVNFLKEQDFERGVREWNVLQAILRRSAHTIDSCFLALQTSVLAMCILAVLGQITDEKDDPCFDLPTPPVLIPLACVFFAMLSSAAVTAKCSRVPALINSWTFDDEPLDPDRQYMVNYIQHSAAGFYVKGVRLDISMVFKCAYLALMVIFGLASNSLLRGS